MRKKIYKPINANTIDFTDLFNLQINDKVKVGELNQYGIVEDIYCGKNQYDYAIIKMEDDTTIEYPIINLYYKNILKDKSFYNDSKIYERKSMFLTPSEKKFYDYIKPKLPKDYEIFPQVNLQTIINIREDKRRNEDLYRNPDFCIFKEGYFRKDINGNNNYQSLKDFKPILIIEINDKRHYTKENTIKRDESVKNILDKANIEIISFKNEEITEGNKDNIIKQILNVIKKNEKED